MTSTQEDLLDEFGPAEFTFDYHPRYNIAPTQETAALVVGRDGPRIGLLRWGLVPHWARDPSIGSRLINARAETLAEKPSFRDAFRRRRCLVLADGFYEWQQTAGGKIPVRVRLASDRPFAFAGLWEWWRPRDRGDPVVSCTIVTTDAAPAIRDIHPRMPVILPPGAREQWLDAGADRETLQELLRPYAGDLEAYRVSTRVNSPAHDDPECIRPV